MLIGSFSYAFYEQIKSERESLINGVKQNNSDNSVFASGGIQVLCFLAIGLLRSKDLIGYSCINNPQQLKAKLLKTKNLIEKEILGQNYKNEYLAVRSLENLEKLRGLLK